MVKLCILNYIISDKYSYMLSVESGHYVNKIKVI